MRFRDIIEKKVVAEASDVCPVCGQTPCNCTTIHENEMKFQALAMAKELHNGLAALTFIDMLAVMSPNNPAKKEVQDLETKINALTTDVGAFIQKYIPDVADADVGDLEDKSKDDEDEEKVKKQVSKPKAEKPMQQEEPEDEEK